MEQRGRWVSVETTEIFGRWEQDGGNQAGAAEGVFQR